MPPTFDPTPSGASANSYCTLAFADDYFGTRLNADAWDALDDPAKERALMAACARLEQERYVGVLPTDGQRLRWPRAYVLLDDPAIVQGAAALPIPGYYDAATVPERVQQAQCELALAFINAGSTDLLAETGLATFAGLNAGPVTIDLRDERPAPGALPMQVKRLLRGLLVTSTGQARTVRG